MWRILIAEDNPKTRKNLLQGLKSLGTCTTASDGEKALKLFHQGIETQKPFDFLLLDITMPKVGGFDILQSIRSFEQTRPASAGKEICIIVITAYKDSLLENYNMGWNDFITKPINIERLIQRMRKLKTHPSSDKNHSASP